MFNGDILFSQVGTVQKHKNRIFLCKSQRLTEKSIDRLIDFPGSLARVSGLPKLGNAGNIRVTDPYSSQYPSANI